MNIQIQETKPNLLLIRFERLSYLAFLKIITEFKINSYEKKELGENFINAPLEQDAEYRFLEQKLEQLEAKTGQSHFLTFGQLLNLDIAISRFALKNFIDRLAADSLAELRSFGHALATRTGIQTTETTNPLATEFNNKKLIPEERIKIIDIDKSFENKLLFYHFFAAGGRELPQIADKLELLTVEQKEKIFESIFATDATTRLPRIIFEHTFCSMEISDEFTNLQTIIRCPEAKIIFRSPSCQYAYPTPNCIFQAGLQELFVSTMEQLKNYFLQTRNQYIIPFIFKQTAIFALNLLQWEILKTQKSPLVTELLDKLRGSFHFIK